MKKYILLPILALILLVIGTGLFVHKDIYQKPFYVGSDNCQSCHEEHYESWKKTLHPKMFRPVEKPEDILGDFDSSDPALTFTKEDVEYVVGSKWEQVYVKMIDGEYYPLPAKWYVIKKEWVPYKVNNWKETPMSKKCNGCHTTGFDPTTFKFTEFGIGCEACHGPGSLHVIRAERSSSFTCSLCHSNDKDNETDIIATVSSSTCGQCHNRGVNATNQQVKEAEFNFPVNVLPGESLGQAFKQLNPEDDKKGRYWWGNGLSKNRHQEYADWFNSKHSQALRLLLEKHMSQPERGELSDACLECHATDYKLAKEGSKPSIETVKHGVTCIACHEPHGIVRTSPHSKLETDTCTNCHEERLLESISKKGKPHYPCPAESVTCADCHMPYIIKTGGFFSLRSHAFKIISPSAAQKLGMPNSCQNGACHTDKSIEWMSEAFQTFYPDVEPISNDK